MRLEHWKGWTIATKAFGFVGVLFFIAFSASMLGAQVVVTSGGVAAGGAAQAPITLADGAVGAVSLGFTSDAPSVGWYRSAASSWGFASGGSERLRIGANQWIVQDAGQLQFGLSQDIAIARGGTSGSLRLIGGTTPTQSGTTCGTGPTITGSNSLGSVTLGTTPGLPCTIVFNGTWTAAPRCFLNPEVLTTGTTTVRATSITTTGFVITSTAALVATDKVSWYCVSS